MNKKYLTAIALLVAATNFAYGQQGSNKVMSLNDLMTSCIVPGGQGQATCEVYLQAVYDTYLLTRTPTSKSVICVKQPAPPRSTVVTDFIVWARNREDLENKPAAEAVIFYLAHRFPCQLQQTSSSQTQQSSSQPQANIPSNDLDAAKAKCTELGFKKGSQQFGKCVLEVSK